MTGTYRIDHSKARAFSMILFKRSLLYIAIFGLIAAWLFRDILLTWDVLYLLLAFAGIIAMSFLQVVQREKAVRTLVVKVDPNMIQNEADYGVSTMIEFKDARLIQMKEGFYLIPKSGLSLISFYSFRRSGIRTVFVPTMLHSYEEIKAYVKSRLKLSH